MVEEAYVAGYEKLRTISQTLVLLERFRNDGLITEEYYNTTKENMKKEVPTIISSLLSSL